MEEVKTVGDACRAYVRHLRNGAEKATPEKAAQAAANAEQMFNAHVYNRALGAIQLAKLHQLDIERWRDSLVTPRRAKNTVNRIYRSLKAALNYVFRLGGLIASDAPWKCAKPFAVKDGTRDVYLTLKQRQALLAACDRQKTEEELAADADLRWTTPAMGDFLRGLALAVARPGELATARVSALDVRAKTLSLTSYRGRIAEAHTRAFPLDDPAALAFFKRMAKDKLPSAYLMTMDKDSGWESEGDTLSQCWAAGFRGARRLANKVLSEQEQIPDKASAYSMRHSRITDLLEAGESLQRVAVVTGTSIEMIERKLLQVHPARREQQARSGQVILRKVGLLQRRRRERSASPPINPFRGWLRNGVPEANLTFTPIDHCCSLSVCLMLAWSRFAILDAVANGKICASINAWNDDTSLDD